MRRREVISLLGGAATAWPLAARAAAGGEGLPDRFPRELHRRPEADLVGPFREGLRDLGYVEGQNILIEYRWAEEYERFPALTAELIALIYES